MELARLGLQTAYGNSNATTAGNALSGAGVASRPEGAREAAENESAAPPASTRVSLSPAGQSRLAAEQQASAQVQATAAQESAAVPQNIPVQQNQQAAQGGNEPNYTAGATPTQAAAQPLQSASVTTPTGGAVPAAAPPASSPAEEASEPAATPQVVGSGAAATTRASQSPDTGNSSGSAPDSQAAPVRQQTEQVAQQERARQDDAARSRQDVSPVLAQGGVAAYREVLSI